VRAVYNAVQIFQLNFRCIVAYIYKCVNHLVEVLAFFILASRRPGIYFLFIIELVYFYAC